MKLLDMLRDVLARHYTIQIPRTRAFGTGNELGAWVARNQCPLCKDKRGFYRGQHPGTIYCGNDYCRTAFTVTNYGPGRVAAHVLGLGPDHLYGKGWGKVPQAITPRRAEGDTPR